MEKIKSTNNYYKMKIISVVGARPNFMKMAPIHKAFEKFKSEKSKVKGEIAIHNSQLTIHHLICHTGQHYDEKMSKVFFNNLELPKPDFYLGVGSGSHAEQTAKVMIEFEKVLLQEKPDLVMVYGDVNSTVACSLVAAKMGVKIAHIESGLRSFDRTMPEEINRIVTDHLADYLFVTEKSGVENLKKEGICEDKIFFVGNTMIDSLIHYLFKAEKSDVLKTYSLQPTAYILVTLHRPSNVDDVENVKQIINMLNKLSEKRKIIFPVHPRTKSVLQSLNLSLNPKLILTDPIGYIDFLALMKNAELVITDSGGIQEETTYLGVQCITVRDNTERPITVEIGTNNLIGTDLVDVENMAIKILNGEKKGSNMPELWDGNTAQRIKEIINNI
ncbi:MAG: non-hydrolyzing UDP-N-acetylglucosamine 2-epimerase [Ignavibacteriaceae bacterium]